MSTLSNKKAKNSYEEAEAAAGAELRDKAAVSAAPRYLVIPIEDVDMSVFSGQTLPVYRVPGLARTARMAQEEDSYQSAPAPYDSQVSGADRHASND